MYISELFFSHNYNIWTAYKKERILIRSPDVNRATPLLCPDKYLPSVRFPVL